MVHKFIALALAGGITAGFATFCFRPVRAVAVDDSDAYAEYLQTLTNVATGGVLPSGALPVLAAQYALVYAYSQATAGSNALHGQSKSFAGFTTYNRETYFGGGSINDTATALVFRFSRRRDDTGFTDISGRYYLNDGAYTDQMSVHTNTYTVGANASTLTECWLLINGSERSRYLTGEWNGEPCGSIHLGSCGDPGWMYASYNSNTSNYSQVVFYDGGYNFSSGFEGLSGTSLPDDMAALHTALLQEYPDVDQQYYLDWDYDPGGGGSGCNCNVTVNVEPTINVEVNVEPTINVEVNVDNQLPSEWLETIPEETTENPLEELPTLEVENFTDVLQEPEEIIGENSGFWWVCLKKWIVDNDKVWKYLLGLFTIAVIGAILRGLG